MRHFTQADYRRRPWKNGGGETLELAIFPHGADLDDFAWRISMATIDRDGPFSRFEGIDRAIMVQRGAGMALNFGGSVSTLRAGDAPYHFDGGRSTACRLLAGPVTDFNIMSRRSLCSNDVTAIGANTTVSGSDATYVLATAAVSFDAFPHGLAQTDLVAIERGESLTIVAGHALAIRFKFREPEHV